MMKRIRPKNCAKSSLDTPTRADFFWFHLPSEATGFASLARVALRNRSAKTMKKVPSAKRKKKGADDLEPEYRFDYRKARPNRFAANFKPGSCLVLLDPDVAEVFTTPESVNAVLRALLETMPPKSTG